MASAIDDTKPITGTPTTQSVRDNFATAKTEITALQAAVPTWAVGSVPFAVSATALGQDNAGLFYNNTNSRLGIGTTAPGGKLTVSSAVSGAPQAFGVTPQVHAAQEGTLAVNLIDAYSSGSTGHAAALYGRRSRGTAAAPSAVQGGDVLLAVRAVGRAATVYSDPFGAPVAQIAMTTPSPWTDTSMPTYIEFSTTPTSTITPAVAMKIDHNGNVGIGTTGPLAKLEVVGGLGLVVGAPTGGALAAGKINAIEVRANNVVLTSDAELKTDIAPLPACLPLLAAIEPKTFRWLPLPEPDPIEGPAGEMVVPQTGPVDFAEKLNRGFLAQEVAEAIGGKAADGVDLGGMVAILWQAVRELSDRVNELEGDKPAPRH